MPLVAAPFNFAALQAALVAVLANATGLPPGQFIYEQPETMNAPRPPYPYVGITVIQAAGLEGPDFYLPKPDLDGQPTGLFTYMGERQLDVTLDVYGQTHAHAYQVCSAIQALLMQIPCRSALRERGLTVWRVGDIQDVSELLNTAYEGRAQIDISFGFIASMDADMGRMDTFEVAARLDDHTEPTATLSEEP